MSTTPAATPSCAAGNGRDVVCSRVFTTDGER